MSGPSIGAAWRAIRDQFRSAALDTPDLDARLLAELAFGLTSLDLVAREREPVAPSAVAKLQALAARRLHGEPVARIMGEKEFWGLAFALNDATLVPRPETEILVRRCLELIGGRRGAHILDLGTGSGCIAIALLSESPSAIAVAIDLSTDAIAMARRNAERHHVADRFDARVGSWFEPLRPDEHFDLIVANPPYIERAVIATLATDVRDHDPVLALDGGADGLDAYRAIVPEAMARLAPGGALLVEIGAGQGTAVKALFAEAGLKEVAVERDLAGLDRIVLGTIANAESTIACG